MTPAERRRGNPERVTMFTDGVFAIIITILVLEIGVPAELPEQSLREAIDETGPELLAWVISFLIVGMYWAWHRDLFNQVRYVNRDVVWLNLLFMMPAALIPFAASVLGEYHDEPIALHLYGAVLIVTSLLRWLLYGYLMRRPSLLWEPPGTKTRRIGGLLAGAPIVIYVIAMLVASAAPRLSLLLYLGVPLLYFLLIALLRRSPVTRDEATNYG
jgi:uncharacterized membrane protein